MPANDINLFAEKIKVLLRHASLRERFEAAIDHRDFSEFTVSTMVKKQERLYRSLVPPTKKNGGKRRFFRRRRNFRKKTGGVQHGLRD